MQKTIKLLEETLAAIDHPFLRCCDAPLKREELIDLFNQEGMAVVDDLIELYLWKGGMSVDLIYSDSYVELCSYGCLVECRSLIDWYKSKLVKEPEIKGKLPFISMDCGDYLAIDLGKQSETLGRIFLYCPSVTVGMTDSIDMLVSIYDSVESYLSSVIECYRQGVYKLDGNILEVDYDLEFSISGKLNPQSEFWKEKETLSDPPELSNTIHTFQKLIAAKNDRNSCDFKDSLQKLDETLAAINHPFLRVQGTPSSIDEIVRNLYRDGIVSDINLLNLYLWNSGIFSAYVYNEYYRDLCSCGSLINHWTAIGQLTMDKLTENKLNNKLPIILSKSQCYVAIDLEQQSKTYGRMFVSSVQRGSEVVQIYDSLKNFVDTIIDCYRLGAYTLSDRKLKIDYRLEAEISLNHNPLSDYWKNIDRYMYLVQQPMSDCIQCLEHALSVVNHPFIRVYEPPETKSDILNMLNQLNLAIDEDFLCLYMWKGGIRDISSYRNHYPEFCSCGSIIDLQSAVVQLKSNRHSMQSASNMLPFIQTKSGNYIAIDLGKQSKTIGQLFLLSTNHDNVEVISIYDSFRDFINTIAECYKFKDIYMLSYNKLEIGVVFETAASRKHNPHSDYWKNVDAYKHLLGF